MKGGVSPYNNLATYDPLEMGLNDHLYNTKVISGFNDLNNPCRFKEQQSQIIGGKNKNNKYNNNKNITSKKGGFNIFNDISSAEIRDISSLGNETKYAPMNVNNIDERKTNFALDLSNQGGGKKNNSTNKKKKGGSDISDIITSGVNNKNIQYSPLNINKLDERGTNFALDLSNQTGGIKQKYNRSKKSNKKKGGFNIFTDVSLDDIINNKHLGNKTEYEAMNFNNTDERGTNFAFEQSQFGGKFNKIIKHKNNIIDKFFHKMIIKSYSNYKNLKNKRGGAADSGDFQSDLANLLVNSFQINKNDMPSSQHFNTTYLGNNAPFKLQEPQKINITLKSNFSI